MKQIKKMIDNKYSMILKALCKNILCMKNKDYLNNLI
jgi:hypothetical protein